MTGDVGRSEFEAVVSSVKDSVDRLRSQASNLVPVPLCEAYRQAEAMRVAVLEKATADLQAAYTALEARFDTDHRTARDRVWNVASVIMAALIGAAGAYAAARAGVR